MSVQTNLALREARFFPDPDVICQRMGQEIVLLNLRTDRFYELNSTAARLWELLCAEPETGLLQEILLSEFEVEPGQLASDIRALIASLKQEGLIINSAPQPDQEGQS